MGDLLRRVQTLATQSNLTIRGFTPAADRDASEMHAEWPIGLELEGNYHNLGLFLDRVSKFPRIINIGNMVITLKEDPTAAASIVGVLHRDHVRAGGAAASGGRRHTEQTEGPRAKKAPTEKTNEPPACSIRGPRLVLGTSHCAVTAQTPAAKTAAPAADPAAPANAAGTRRAAAAGQLRLRGGGPPRPVRRADRQDRPAARRPEDRRPRGRRPRHRHRGTLGARDHPEPGRLGRDDFRTDGKATRSAPAISLADGTIRTITAEAVIIQQQVNDPLSLEKQREVRKFLRGGENK